MLPLMDDSSFPPDLVLLSKYNEANTLIVSDVALFVHLFELEVNWPNWNAFHVHTASING